MRRTRFWLQQRRDIPKIVRDMLDEHQIVPSQWADKVGSRCETPLQRLGVALIEDVIGQLAKGPFRNKNFIGDLNWVKNWNDHQTYSFTFEQAFYAGYPRAQITPEVLSAVILKKWEEWSRDGLKVPMRHFVPRRQQQKVAAMVAAALLGLCLWVRPAVAYNTTADDVVFASAQTVTASTDLAPVAPNTAWIRHGSCLLDVTAASGTLDVYLQTTMAGTDDDYCRFTQVSGTGKRWLSFSAVSSTATTADHAVSDLSSGVTAGQCRTGPLGQRLKAAVVVSGGGSFTFSLTCHLTEN